MTADILPFDRSEDDPSWLDAEQPRVAPQDLDAEASLVSVLMADESAFEKVLDVRPEHFSSETHRRMFEAIADLAPSGRPDPVRVASWLNDCGRLAQVGGMAGITEVGNVAPAVANVRHYADIVIEKARARALILACQKGAALGYIGRGADEIESALLADVEAQRPTSSGADLVDGAALAETLPPLDYLVAELGLVAGAGAPHMVAGYGFSAKSVAVQAMALSLAAGQPLWGVYSVKPRRVLHVDLEQGRRLTQRRYQRLARAMGVALAELGDALSVAVMPPLTLTASCSSAWRSLMAGRDLLVVDSLRAASPGQDENSSDIRSGLDMLGALSEAMGCRCLVLHHARKAAQDDPGGRFAIRGSSALFDACDSVYLFCAEKDEPVSVEHVKARSHGEPVAPWALVVSDVDVDDDPRAGLRVQVHGVELVAERREAHQDSARKAQGIKDASKIRAALASKPGASSTELRGLTRLSGDRLAAALVEIGNVEVRTETIGRSTTKRHYLKGAP